MDGIFGAKAKQLEQFFSQVDGFGVPPPAGRSLLRRPALPHLPGRRLPGEHMHHHPRILFCHIGDHDDDDNYI